MAGIWEFQLMAWILVLYLGACVGSFLNVVVYRVPHQLSLLQPGSHCPKCKAPLGPTENVPILGWLWLRGRCRHCGQPISWRYPAVEAFTMATYGLTVGVLGLTPHALGMCLLMSWLIALALIDLDTLLLPESLTQSGVVVGAAIRVLLPWLMGDGSAQASAASLMEGISGAVLGILLLESIGLLGQILLRKEALGLGDGKLMALIGMWLGWPNVLLTLFLASIIGVIGSGIGLLMKRVRLGRPIPFGPYLAAAGGLAALIGPQIISSYLDLIGL